MKGTRWMDDSHHISMTGFLQVMFATLWDKISAALATTALLPPVWRPTLSDVSDFFSLLTPILGGVWFIIQGYAKILEIRRLKRDRCC
jgi:hypothetical protein